MARTSESRPWPGGPTPPETPARAPGPGGAETGAEPEDARAERPGGNAPAAPAASFANGAVCHVPDAGTEVEFVPGADLSGRDLRGRDLMGVDLSGANLSGCDLSDVHLFKARLVGANLSHARLTGAELTGADLTRAVMQDVKAANAGFGMATMRGAQMFNATLTGASLSKADLRGADLRCVDLSGARLRATDLTDCDLTSACLVRADLSMARVTRASFRQADVREARMRALEDFENTDWIGVEIHNSHFAGAYRLRRFVIDQNYLMEFRSSSPAAKWLYYLWWITSDCGRSLGRWVLWIVIQTTFFAWLYTLVSVDYGGDPSPLSPLYFSVVTFTTLGFGDVLPVTAAAQAVVMTEVFFGYVMLGGLLSIFSNIIARRGE